MRNKIIKIFLSSIFAVFLGVIGCGLWERVFSHIVDWVVEVTIIGMDYIMDYIICFYKDSIYSYKDSIYDNAAKGFHERSSLMLYVLVLAICPILYLFPLGLIYAVKKSREKSKDSVYKIVQFVLSKKVYYSLIILIISIFIMFGISMSQILYTNNVITYSFRSIEILSPFLSNQEFKEIKAQYYSVKSAEDYYKFNSKLKKIAEENNIELPKFNAL